MNSIPEYISLGAGVQSSTLALMAAKGQVHPMQAGAIFADTQAEPKAIYEWLNWLEKQLPFPVYRVTAGSLTEASLKIVTNRKTGKQYARNFIPAYAKNPDGSKGIVGRRCTFDFKIRPIMKKVRELASIGRGQKHIGVIQWVGISLDEVHRMKPSRDLWAKIRWPLIELEMTRHDCLRWMEKNGFPTPPRSACIYCPFHSDNEWKRLKQSDPDAFKFAVEFEKQFQETTAKTGSMRATPFLHDSLVPLGEIDFSEDSTQGQLKWGNECEGMCGV